jgi:hypothetical protein
MFNIFAGSWKAVVCFKFTFQYKHEPQNHFLYFVLYRTGGDFLFRHEPGRSGFREIENASNWNSIAFFIHQPGWKTIDGKRYGGKSVCNRIFLYNLQEYLSADEHQFEKSV